MEDSQHVDNRKSQCVRYKTVMMRVCALEKLWKNKTENVLYDSSSPYSIASKYFTEVLIGKTLFILTLKENVLFTSIDDVGFLNSFCEKNGN